MRLALAVLVWISLWTPSGHSEIGAAGLGQSDAKQPGAAEPLVPIARLPLHVATMVHDATSGRLYLALRSPSAGGTGQIVWYDVESGELGPPLKVDGSPSRLAVSDDGAALYAVVGGRSVRRIDVQTWSLDEESSPALDGTEALIGGVYPLPGSSRSVLIPSDRAWTAAVFDGAIRRPKVAPRPVRMGVTILSTDTFAFVGDGQVIGCTGSSESGSLFRLEVDDDGVSLAEELPEYGGCNPPLRADDGVVHVSSGAVDMRERRPLGFFPLGPFALDTGGRRRLSADWSTAIGSRTCPSNTFPINLVAHDVDRFTLLGAVVLEPCGLATEVEYLGQERVALRLESGEVVIYQVPVHLSRGGAPLWFSSPKPAAPGVPPAPTATPAPTPTPPFMEAREIALPMSLYVSSLDALWRYDPEQRRIYFAVPGHAGSGGNSVMWVSPATGEVSAPLYVGSYPRIPAISVDGSTLYIAAERGTRLKRVDTTRWEVDPESWPLPWKSTGMVYRGGLAAHPHRRETLAFAPESRTGALLSVMDGGVVRPRTASLEGRLVLDLSFDPGGEAIYACVVSRTGTPRYELLKLAVSEAGVLEEQTEAVPGLCAYPQRFGDRIVAGRHDVAAEPLSRIGQYRFRSGSDAERGVIDAETGRAYFFDVGDGTVPAPQVLAFSRDTFQVVGSLPVIGLPRLAPHLSISLIRWSADGFALITGDGRVFTLTLTGTLP